MDWHRTQNSSYLNLLENRLKQPRLKWVEQFIEIINTSLGVPIASEERKNIPIVINDIGCNVGHFYRAIDEKQIHFPVDYCGYDISETYLQVAQSSFNDAIFKIFDIQSQRPRDCDITVISATLEHVSDHKSAIQNIFYSTSRLVIMRTFLGESEIVDQCLTDGAEQPYLIKQFCLDKLVDFPLSQGFRYYLLLDEATKSQPKFVCNGKSILRQQNVIVFEKVE
jgi:hypothetical protein